MDVVAGRGVTRLSMTVTGTWSAEMAAGARVVFGAKADGDFAEPGAAADGRRELADVPWTWLRQVHGPGLWSWTSPGHCGQEADAAVTCAAGAALAVLTADCAPVGLRAPRAWPVCCTPDGGDSWPG